MILYTSYNAPSADDLELFATLIGLPISERTAQTLVRKSPSLLARKAPYPVGFGEAFIRQGFQDQESLSSSILELVLGMRVHLSNYSTEQLTYVARKRMTVVANKLRQFSSFFNSQDVQSFRTLLLSQIHDEKLEPEATPLILRFLTPSAVGDLKRLEEFAVEFSERRAGGRSVKSHIGFDVIEVAGWLTAMVCQVNNRPRPLKEDFVALTDAVLHMLKPDFHPLGKHGLTRDTTALQSPWAHLNSKRRLH